MSVFKNISYFLGAAVLSKPLGFLLAFALAKSLEPANFGVWVTLTLVISYSPIVVLGTVETLLKQVPYYLGRGEAAQIQEVENSVMGSVVLSAVVVVGLAFLAPLVLPFTSLGIDSPLVVMMLLTAATGYFSAYFYNRFAAYENFKAAGAMDFLRSILALLFVGGMGWIWGLRGAVAGYLLHEISMCFLTTFLNVRSHGKVGVNFHRDLLIRAVRVGFPITLLWWILTLTGTVDRIVLGSLLGPLSVGHYGLGLSLVGTLSFVPTVVGRVLYPKVNKQFGKDREAKSMKRLILAPTLAMGTLLVNLQVVLLVIMPFLYNQLLPKYQPGLMAGQILILGSFFGCLLRNGANYLIAANQERVFLKYILITLAFNIISDVSLVKGGLGIAGVALGTSFAGLLLTSLVWRRVLIGLGFRQRRAWTTLLGLYLPIIVLAGAAAGLRLAYPPAFQILDGLAVVLGLGVLLLVNGLLYCFPVYREEMHGWRKALLRMKESLAERAALADTNG
jgi:O-antigen/teichoic acid export membrane protein